MYAMHLKNRFRHVHVRQLRPISRFAEYCSRNPRFLLALIVIGLVALMAGLVMIGLVFGQDGSELPYSFYSPLHRYYMYP